jgi:multidrug efflux pump subunit AcrA (membrane-fusion protein)
MIEARIIAGVLLLAAVFGSGWMVRGWKEDAEDLAVAETRKAAMQGAAEAIAKIEVVNKTIYQKAQTTVIEKPVYRECAHEQDMVDKVNAALVAP